MQVWWPMPREPGVDHHDDLVLEDAHHVCGALVAYLIDDLDLEEVVARPQASELRCTALLGAFADLVGLERSGVLAVVLGELRVRSPSRHHDEVGSFTPSDSTSSMSARLNGESTLTSDTPRSIPSQLVHDLDGCVARRRST